MAVTTAIALAFAAWIMQGITIGGEDVSEKIVPLLLISLIFCVITVFVEPILTILSIPFIIITLGLFLLVINAGMLLLTSWLADQLDIAFHVDGFWVAVGGSIIITVATWLMDLVFG